MVRANSGGLFCAMPLPKPMMTNEVYYNLLLHIRTECSRNRMVYSPILEHGVQNSLDHESENYIMNKGFNTLFGDMVPNIVANILNQDIFIIEKAAPREHFVTVISPREDTTQLYRTHRAGECTLIFLKTGRHYDARVPVCECPILRLYQSSDFNSVTMNQSMVKSGEPTSGVACTNPYVTGHVTPKQWATECTEKDCLFMNMRNNATTDTTIIDAKEFFLNEPHSPVLASHSNADDFILNESHKLVSTTRPSDMKYGEPDNHGHCRDNTNIPRPGTEGVNIIDTSLSLMCVTTPR